MNNLMKLVLGLLVSSALINCNSTQNAPTEISNNSIISITINHTVNQDVK